MTEPVDNLLSRLEGVRQTKPGSWVARCPAHEDRSPSLSITESDDGRVLIYDHAGCGAAEVLSAVGMEFGDLYPDSGHRHKPRRQKHHPASVLKALNGDAMFMLFCSDELRKGNALSDSTMDELAVVNGRIRRAVEMGR